MEIVKLAGKVGGLEKVNYEQKQFEKLDKRLIGFCYLDKTTKGTYKQNLVIEDVRGIGKVRMMLLPCKGHKVWRVYRSSGKNKDLFRSLREEGSHLSKDSELTPFDSDT